MDTLHHFFLFLMFMHYAVGSNSTCLKILPDSISKIPVEVGKNFTATCHLLEGSGYTSDDIEWVLGNISIAKQYYHKINETSVSVTVNVNSNVKGWLFCKTRKSLSFQSPCVYGILLDVGYPPLKPENLTCIAVQEGTDISSDLKCSWESESRDPLLDTTYTLHATILKPNPPLDVQVLAEVNFSTSLIVTWKHPIDKDTMKLLYVIRYRQVDSDVWTEVPESLIRAQTSFRLQSLEPYTEYVVQMRSIQERHQSYWSEWSATATVRTTEARQRIDIYAVCGLFDKAYSASACVGKGQKGFKACGMWPVDKTVYKDEDFEGAEVTEEPDPTLEDSREIEEEIKKPTERRKRKRISSFLNRPWKAMKSPFRCCCPCSDVDVMEPFVPPPDLEPEPDPEPPSPAPDHSGFKPINEKPIEHRKRKRIGSFLNRLWKAMKSPFRCCCPCSDVDVMEPFVPPPDLEPEPDPEPPSPAPDHSGVKPINESFESLYNVGEMLGSGGFGRVYEGTRKFDDKKVAIKQMLKIDNDCYLHIPGHPKPLVTEVALLLMMRREPISPYVIHLFEWFDHPQTFTLVMEYPEPCESLRDFITRNPRLCEPAAQVIVLQAMLAEHRLTAQVLTLPRRPNKCLGPRSLVV
ncbi:Interleukin-6 receptor subunit beta [Anabarilius grahami]|uniref:non-specific serine/threonine protein kinase n=1 Tax=Anabarilius grahami TaxID=495550 RepID=A0A3N0YQW0_ANAGA|nr:Interleukin-6 receptor subunit beta [Anabarilius grahami]